MGVLAKLLESRQSIESPSTPFSLFFDAGYGARTKSGARISESTADTIAAVYCAKRVLSEGVASLPFILYRRVPNGGRERATDHPLYAVLHEMINPYMGAFQGKDLLMSHAVGWGNAYAEIVRRRESGDVAQLWPLLPDRTWVEVQNGRKFYVTTIDGVRTPIPADRVLHIPGPGFDGFSGKSVIRMARESLGLNMAAEQFGASLFGGGARPSGTLETDKILSPEGAERLRADFERTYGGLDNAQRTVVLEEGMKFSPMSIPPEDAQFLETRKFQVTEVARWFRVPPHKIMDLERGTFSNIEHQSIEFVRDALLSWMVRFEEAVTMSLLTSEERQTHFVEFLVDGALRGDSAARGALYNQLFQLGSISPNEIRARENLNPIEGGDQYFVQLNMIPLAMADDVMEDDEGQMSLLPSATSRLKLLQERRREAHRPVFVDAFQRITNRELIQVRRAAVKYADQPDAWRDWVEAFYRTWPTEVTLRVAPAVDAYIRSSWLGLTGLVVEADVTPMVHDLAQRCGTRWMAVSRAQIRKGENLDKLWAAWQQERAGTTADEEMARIDDAVAEFAASGGKRWISET